MQAYVLGAMVQLEDELLSHVILPQKAFIKGPQAHHRPSQPQAPSQVNHRLGNRAIGARATASSPL